MKIVDVIKKKLLSSQKSRPIPGAVAVPDKWDRFSTHPGENLTPEKLAELFREAEMGNILRQVELFEEMEEKDTHLFSQLQTRKNGVAGLDWSILPASDSDEDGKVAEFVREVLHNLEDMDDLILDLLDAIGKGFSVAEIMWDYSNGYVIPEAIKWRHAKKFTFDELDNLRILTNDHRSEGIEIPENKFIVHKYKARSGSPTRAGILRVASWMYLFKNYAVKDWLAFSEVYGMPIRIGKYEEGASQADKEALMQAVINIGTDAAAVISSSTVLEFIESQRSEGLLYDRLIKLCNGEMSKAILGQTLTTEVSSDGGSRALGDVQNLVRYDLLKADCRSLEKTLRRDLLRPLVMFNFGEEVTPPYFKLPYERAEDLEKEASKYQTLVGMGLPVSTEHIYEKFGIPAPEKGQKVLEPPVSSPMPGLPGMFKRKTTKDQKAFSQQQEIDQMASSGVLAAQLGVDAALEPLLRIIEGADSLEGLREKLLDTYQDLDSAELEDLLAKTLYLADLMGRSEVMDDAE